MARRTASKIERWRHPRGAPDGPPTRDWVDRTLERRTAAHQDGDADGLDDLNRDTTPLVNKVRPIVRSGGALIVVNDALSLSGAAFMAELEALCAGGWMTIDALIGVPADVTGYPGTRRQHPPRTPPRAP